MITKAARVKYLLECMAQDDCGEIEIYWASEDGEDVDSSQHRISDIAAEALELIIDIEFSNPNQQALL